MKCRIERGNKNGFDGMLKIYENWTLKYPDPWYPCNPPPSMALVYLSPPLNGPSLPVPPQWPYLLHGPLFTCIPPGGADCEVICWG